MEASDKRFTNVESRSSPDMEGGIPII